MNDFTDDFETLFSPDEVADYMQTVIESLEAEDAYKRQIQKTKKHKKSKKTEIERIGVCR